MEPTRIELTDEEREAAELLHRAIWDVIYSRWDTPAVVVGALSGVIAQYLIGFANVRGAEQAKLLHGVISLTSANMTIEAMSRRGDETLQ